MAEPHRPVPRLVAYDISVTSDAVRPLITVDIVCGRSPVVSYVAYSSNAPLDERRSSSHRAQIVVHTSNTATSIRSKLTHKVYDPYAAPQLSSSATANFTLYVPTLTASPHQHVAHLDTRSQRLESSLFFPNPPALFHRVPAINSAISTATATTLSAPSSIYPAPGLYTAVYGPHSTELLFIHYTVNSLVAVKILGDSNVPSAKVSFRIHIATKRQRRPPIVEAETFSGLAQTAQRTRAQHRRQRDLFSDEKEDGGSGSGSSSGGIDGTEYNKPSPPNDQQPPTRRRRTFELSNSPPSTSRSHSLPDAEINEDDIILLSDDNESESPSS